MRRLFFIPYIRVGILFVLILFAFLPIPSIAQEYFQQNVKYSIDVKLNDKKHQLSAYEEIVYHNNSTQKLTELYFHLWPNAYANDNTALANELYKNGDYTYRQLGEKSCGFIDSLDFMVDRQTVKWSLLQDTIDILQNNIEYTFTTGRFDHDQYSIPCSDSGCKYIKTRAYRSGIFHHAMVPEAGSV